MPGDYYDGEKATQDAKVQRLKAGQAKRADDQRALGQRARKFHMQIELGQRIALTMSREQLRSLATGACVKVLTDVITGQVEVRNGTEAANVARAFYDIACRESGEAGLDDTPILTREDRLAVVRELTAKLRPEPAAQ